MRSSSCSPCWKMHRLIGPPGIICPALLTLAVGCAPLHYSPSMSCCSATPYVQAVNEPSAKTTQVPTTTAEPPSHQLEPAQELPPIGRLGFSLEPPEDQGETLPPVHSDGYLQISNPITAAAAQPRTLVEELIGPQPRSAAKAHPVDEINFLQGDPTKLVPLCLDTVLRKCEANKLVPAAMLEASTSYVDLLSARATIAVAIQMEGRLENLLRQTAALANASPSAEAEIPRIRAELDAEKMLVCKAREAAGTVTAKLLYYLGFDPRFGVAITDHQFVAFTLVNADTPVDGLVGQALRNSPSYGEIEAQLRSSQAAVANEGARGSMISQAVHRESENGAQNRMGQLQVVSFDMRGKLTMAVQESRESIFSARDQLEIGRDLLNHATDALERSESRFTKAPNPRDRSPSDMMLALRGLQAAKLAYVTAIGEHDKAQLRLAILTGILRSSQGP
jgi:hypothetical protein